MVTRSSFALGVFTRGVLQVAQFGAGDRATGIIKAWGILQQVHGMGKPGGKMAYFRPNCSDLSIRVVPKSSEKLQVDSRVPTLHNSKRGLHTGSAGRIKQSFKLATRSLEVPSNILTSLVGDGLGARSEEFVVQLLDTSLVSAQGTFHMRYPGIQSYSKVLDVPSVVRSNNFTAHSAGSGNGFSSDRRRVRPGI